MGGPGGGEGGGDFGLPESALHLSLRKELPSLESGISLGVAPLHDEASCPLGWVRVGVRYGSF